MKKQRGQLLTGEGNPRFMYPSRLSLPIAGQWEWDKQEIGCSRIKSTVRLHIEEPLYSEVCAQLHPTLQSLEFPRQEYWSGLLAFLQGSILSLLCLLHWQADSIQRQTYVWSLKGLRRLCWPSGGEKRTGERPLQVRFRSISQVSQPKEVLICMITSGGQ